MGFWVRAYPELDSWLRAEACWSVLRQSARYGLGLLGVNASATARVISRRWNDDEIRFVFSKRYGLGKSCTCVVSSCDCDCELCLEPTLIALMCSLWMLFSRSVRLSRSIFASQTWMACSISSRDGPCSWWGSCRLSTTALTRSRVNKVAPDSYGRARGPRSIPGFSVPTKLDFRVAKSARYGACRKPDSSVLDNFESDVFILRFRGTIWSYSSSNATLILSAHSFRRRRLLTVYSTLTQVNPQVNPRGQPSLVIGWHIDGSMCSVRNSSGISGGFRQLRKYLYRERHRREGFWRVPFEDPLCLQ